MSDNYDYVPYTTIGERIRRAPRAAWLFMVGAWNYLFAPQIAIKRLNFRIRAMQFADSALAKHTKGLLGEIDLLHASTSLHADAAVLFHTQNRNAELTRENQRLQDKLDAVYAAHKRLYDATMGHITAPNDTAAAAMETILKPEPTSFDEPFQAEVCRICGARRTAIEDGLFPLCANGERHGQNTKFV